MSTFFYRIIKNMILISAQSDVSETKRGKNGDFTAVCFNGNKENCKLSNQKRSICMPLLGYHKYALL